ncbi:MAG: hypothetical protein J7M14_06500 [Planctomycetes bacterium]|nr:hypothetical protein [Planctomycetota bacterium]
MLGIKDPYVLLAYLLCVASTILCVVYGLINWNRGQESIRDEDIRWAEEEKKIEADT